MGFSLGLVPLEFWKLREINIVLKGQAMENLTCRHILTAQEALSTQEVRQEAPKFEVLFIYTASLRPARAT